MATLTSDQIDDLASAYQDLAQALLNYKIENTNTLSAADFDDLSSKTDVITSLSNQLGALEVQEIETDITAQLNSLKQASTDIDSALKTIKNVQSVINIAAAVVDVGSSIVTFNAGKVISNISALVGAIKAV